MDKKTKEVLEKTVRKLYGADKLFKLDTLERLENKLPAGPIKDWFTDLNQDISFFKSNPDVNPENHKRALQIIDKMQEKLKIAPKEIPQKIIQDYQEALNFAAGIIKSDM